MARAQVKNTNPETRKAAPQKAGALRERSQRGASMSFALLLFLVCALLTSIVLAAATGAAGQSLNLAERDKNYYNTVSAAELIKNMVEDDEVIFESSEDELAFIESNGSKSNVAYGQTITNQSKDLSGSISYGRLSTLSFLYLLGNNSVVSNSTKLIDATTPGDKSAEEDKNFNTSTLNKAIQEYFNTDTTYYHINDDQTANYKKYVISNYGLKLATAGDEDVEKALSEVNIQQKVFQDGSFEVLVSSGEDDQTLYSVRLRCEPDFNAVKLVDSDGVKERVSLKWHVTQLYHAYERPEGSE